ncbi:MAG: NAD(+)/NADH kinase, partial [Myxococcales bacterium]|nr:NAD(+)/NADH kinase [Polyangiaceae bacterium]MDW8249770.1 NAD(+)/NADH kinase [Myxococcales bacterium]
MSRSTVVLVAKRSAWTNHVERSPDPLVLDLLRRQDPTVARMRAAHEAHEGALAAVRSALAAAQVDVLTVEDLHQPFPTDDASLVLTVGGDGTLLGASHQIKNCPVLGVNSAPGISVGFFCGADASSIGRLLPRALSGSLEGVKLTRMEVRFNEQVLSRRVLNDALLCHACPAATSRYILELDGEQEEQRSSGMWV